MNPRWNLKTVNDELARLGYAERLDKGHNYFFFKSGDAENWIERSVGVRTISSLTVKQWIAEFRRLKELNDQIRRTVKGTPAP